MVRDWYNRDLDGHLIKNTGARSHPAIDDREMLINGKVRGTRRATDYANVTTRRSPSQRRVGGAHRRPLLLAGFYGNEATDLLQNKLTGSGNEAKTN